MMREQASRGFDRRHFPRSVLAFPATAVRHDRPLDHPKRVVGLRILDVSRGGIGAIAHEPLGPREAVTVFFPPMGALRGQDTLGHVVQCFGHEDRFRVSIRFRDPWPEHELIRSD